MLGAVGLSLADLFPENPAADRAPRERKPWGDRQLYEIIDRETIAVFIAACDVTIEGRTLSDVDMSWLRKARDPRQPTHFLAKGANVKLHKALHERFDRSAVDVDKITRERKYGETVAGLTLDQRAREYMATNASVGYAAAIRAVARQDSALAPAFVGEATRREWDGEDEE